MHPPNEACAFDPDTSQWPALSLTAVDPEGRLLDLDRPLDQDLVARFVGQMCHFDHETADLWWDSLHNVLLALGLHRYIHADVAPPDGRIPDAVDRWHRERKVVRALLAGSAETLLLDLAVEAGYDASHPKFANPFHLCALLRQQMTPSRAAARQIHGHVLQLRPDQFEDVSAYLYELDRLYMRLDFHGVGFENPVWVWHCLDALDRADPQWRRKLAVLETTRRRRGGRRGRSAAAAAAAAAADADGSQAELADDDRWQSFGCWEDLMEALESKTRNLKLSGPEYSKKQGPEKVPRAEKRITSPAEPIMGSTSLAESAQEKTIGRLNMTSSPVPAKPAPERAIGPDTTSSPTPTPAGSRRGQRGQGQGRDKSTARAPSVARPVSTRPPTAHGRSNEAPRNKAAAAEDQRRRAPSRARSRAAAAPRAQPGGHHRPATAAPSMPPRNVPPPPRNRTPLHVNVNARHANARHAHAHAHAVDPMDGFYDVLADLRLDDENDFVADCDLGDDDDDETGGGYLGRRNPDDNDDDDDDALTAYVTIDGERRRIIPGYAARKRKGGHSLGNAPKPLQQQFFRSKFPGRPRCATCTCQHPPETYAYCSVCDFCHRGGEAECWAQHPHLRGTRPLREKYAGLNSSSSAAATAAASRY